jgi:hypothetical protein
MRPEAVPTCGLIGNRLKRMPDKGWRRRFDVQSSGPNMHHQCWGRSSDDPPNFCTRDSEIIVADHEPRKMRCASVAAPLHVFI